MDMTQTKSGLLIPVARTTQTQLDAEMRAAREKYESDHALCPDCGNVDLCRTTMGMVLLPGGSPYEDRNKAWCSCGWKGIVDQMVPNAVTQSGE